MLLQKYKVTYYSGFSLRFWKLNILINCLISAILVGVYYSLLNPRIIFKLLAYDEFLYDYTIELASQSIYPTPVYMTVGLYVVGCVLRFFIHLSCHPKLL